MPPHSIAMRHHQEILPKANRHQISPENSAVRYRYKIPPWNTAIKNRLKLPPYNKQQIVHFKQTDLDVIWSVGHWNGIKIFLGLKSSHIIFSLISISIISEFCCIRSPFELLFPWVSPLVENEKIPRDWLPCQAKYCCTYPRAWSIAELNKAWFQIQTIPSFGTY